MTAGAASAAPFHMRTLLAAIFWLASSLVFAQDASTVEKLAFGESDEQVEAIAQLVAVGNDKAAVILQALADGELVTAGKRVLIVKGDAATDAVTGAKLPAVPADKEDISVNNRLRRELAGALAALKLVSPQREVRLAAAKELGGGADPAMLPLVKKALSQETDPAIKPMLEQIVATLELRADDRNATARCGKKTGQLEQRKHQEPAAVVHRSREG